MLSAGSPVDAQEAKEYFLQAREDYRAGQFEKAIHEFLAADQLKPAAALAYNIAEAYEKMGDLARAYYRIYLARDPHASDHVLVEATVSNLQRRVAATSVAPVVVVDAPVAPAPASPGPEPVILVTVPGGSNRCRLWFLWWRLGGRPPRHETGCWLGLSWGLERWPQPSSSLEWQTWPPSRGRAARLLRELLPAAIAKLEMMPRAPKAGEMPPAR